MNADTKIEDILTNEALRQREFPITRNKIYFAHAAVCPLPDCVASAMTNYVQRVAQAGQFGSLHRDAEAGARAIAADLLGVTAEEIAFVPSTSAGLSLVANGIDWEVGDSVVIAEGDFPANLYPWLSLERLSVRVKTIPANARSITLSDVCQQLDERTRLVSLSSIHFSTGAPIDIDTIGKYLRGENILFCVDAIQSFGAVPCSARHVDFLVADGHKWLLAPQGMGVFFVRREAFERLRPALVGWKSVTSPDNYYDVHLAFPDSAQRYEPGSLNTVGLVGLHAALALLQQIGIENIAKHLTNLRTRLVEGLLALGYQIWGTSAAHVATGITSFQGLESCMSKTYRWLDNNNCVVSLRQNRHAQEIIRISPHFYNTMAEIESFFELLSNQ